jgi:prevent-host-death family protein
MEAVMVKKVRVTEAKAHLSALMARAGYAGERYLIERRGKPLAALVGVEDLQRLEAEGGPSIGGPRRRWPWWGRGASSWGMRRSTRWSGRSTPHGIATPGVRWTWKPDVLAGH